MTVEWRAGAAEVVITPPLGGELEGYGNRQGVSTGVHDDLRATYRGSSSTRRCSTPS
jgi:hypothetical protein